MPNSFSEKGFKAMYESNIFRYRVLGRTLHLLVYHKLESIDKVRNFKEDPVYAKRLRALDPDANEAFYLTYFVLAILFTVLTALGLLYLFDSQGLFDMSDSKKILITSGMILLIGFTQFTLTPYDNITYFFVVLNAILSFQYLRKQNWSSLVVVCFGIMASTLNHESSLVSLALLAGTFFSCYGLNYRFVKLMVFPAACYLLTWIGLRMFIPNDPSEIISDGFKLERNFDTKDFSDLIGILSGVVIFYLLLNLTDRAKNRRLVRNFLLMASPYLVIIPLVGILIEVRLWMPVILGAIILSQVNYSFIESFSKKIIYKTKDFKPVLMEQ